jgi:Arc/MetJ-type ribon-helix-helix transcriptional regulator
MNIVPTAETRKFLEEQMRKGGYSTPEDVVRIALESLAQPEGEPLEDLDPEALAAIERAEAQAERRDGIPVDQTFAQLRRRHSGG